MSELRRKLVIVGDGACGKTCLLIVFSKVSRCVHGAYRVWPGSWQCCASPPHFARSRQQRSTHMGASVASTDASAQTGIDCRAFAALDLARCADHFQHTVEALHCGHNHWRTHTALRRLFFVFFFFFICRSSLLIAGLLFSRSGFVCVLGTHLVVFLLATRLLGHLPRGVRTHGFRELRC